MSELKSSVVANLQDTGFFYDPLEREITETFMPHLLSEMETHLDSLTIARQIADELLAAAGTRKQKIAEEQAKLQAEVDEAKRKAEEERLAKEAEAARIAAEAAADAERIAAEEAAAAAAAEATEEP